MKILCVTSSQPGHIDFGGEGFVVLAKKLQCLGNEVSWISFGGQVERLHKVGFEAESRPFLIGLCVMPYFDVKDIGRNLNHHQFRVECLVNFRALLEKEDPDLILIDRLLAYGGIVAEQLDIPYLAIGTPGGHWNFLRSNKSINVSPSSEAVNSFQDYSDCLINELGWKRVVTGSFWLNSPILNICFMPRWFYPMDSRDGHLCANVHHHKHDTVHHLPIRVGISFGNQGDHDLLLKSLKTIVVSHSIPKPIDVFVGNNERLHQNLRNTYLNNQLKLHRWVNFESHFNNLSCLFFLGGVGTIWRCIDNNLPMLIIPGEIGDQQYNAIRVDRFGLGVHFKEIDLTETILSPIVEKCFTNFYQEKLDECKGIGYYSDTMESVCTRIINL